MNPLNISRTIPFALVLLGLLTLAGLFLRYIALPITIIDAIAFLSTGVIMVMGQAKAQNNLFATVTQIAPQVTVTSRLIRCKNDGVTMDITDLGNGTMELKCNQCGRDIITSITNVKDIKKIINEGKKQSVAEQLKSSSALNTLKEIGSNIANTKIADTDKLNKDIKLSDK